MGWLTAPREKVSKQLAVIDGQQNFMNIPDGTGAGRGRNFAGMLQPDGSFANYASAGYGRNELVYACIRYRAESLPQAQLRVYPDDRPRTPAVLPGNGPSLDDHRLRKLFEKPNPITEEFEFFELSSTYKDLAGTCFWLVVKGRNRRPTQLWPLCPDLVGVLPNPNDASDYVWIYRPDRTRPEFMVPIPNAGSERARDSDTYMIRIRYPNPNPNDPGYRFFGQPPLRAAARATTLDNAATDFADTLLRNHAMPSVVVETESEINKALHERLSASWRAAFSGNNRGTPAFMQKGMKIVQLGITPKDLEFPDLREVSEARICAAFGVEPVLVGTKLGLTHNAYKDYREARLAFWEEAMASEQRRFVEPVRTYLLPSFTGVGQRRVAVEWDNSGVLALKEAEQARWDRATNALARGGITRNQFLQIIGLPTVPGGDVFLTPSGVVPQQVGEDLAAVEAGSVSASLGMLAVEYGIELTADELQILAGRGEREGINHGG